MFDWLAKGAAKFLQAGAEYLQTQAFVQSLFTVPQPQALAMVQAHVASLDDDAYKRFVGHVWGMLASEQQALQAGQGANDPNSWGSSVEDHIAYYQAHIQAGPSPITAPSRPPAASRGCSSCCSSPNSFVARWRVLSHPQRRSARCPRDRPLPPRVPIPHWLQEASSSRYSAHCRRSTNKRCAPAISPPSAKRCSTR